MPRPLRVEFPDALYHVTSRGIGGMPIISDDHDCVKWMEYLKAAVQQFGLELYAFVLMTNHFHLFVATPLGNLQKAMQYLNGAYAMYFNVRHGRGGHLFERRYRGIVIENEGHYTEVSRYIHLNPVRAGIVERPEEYAWSSYGGYHFGRMPLSWLNYDRVLAEFGEGKKARARYREFVAEGVGRKVAPPWAHAISEWVLGSPKFVAKVYGILSSKSEDGRWRSRAAVKGNRFDAGVEEIGQAVCHAFAVRTETLRYRGIGSEDARSGFMLVARTRCGLPLQQIGDYLGIKNRAPVSQSVGRAREREVRDKAFRAKIAKVEAKLAKRKIHL